MSFSSPNSTWTVQNSPDNVDTRLQSKNAHHLQWIQDRAFIVAHHASLQVSTLYGNREIWKCSLFVLNSPKTHYPAYWKYTRSPELRIPLHARHAVVVPTVSALEGFHCNYKIYCEEVTLGSFWGIYVGLYLISILFAMWSHKKKAGMHWLLSAMENVCQ